MPSYVLPAGIGWNTVSNTPCVVALECAVNVWVGHEWPDDVRIVVTDADKDSDWDDPSLAIGPWDGMMELPLGKALYCSARGDLSLVFSCEEACEVLELGGGTNIVYKHVTSPTRTCQT